MPVSSTLGPPTQSRNRYITFAGGCGIEHRPDPMFAPYTFVWAFEEASRSQTARPLRSQQEPEREQDRGDQDRDAADALAPSYLRFVSLAAEEVEQREQEAG
jgi:hypothetical protein